MANTTKTRGPHYAARFRIMSYRCTRFGPLLVSALAMVLVMGCAASDATPKPQRTMTVSNPEYELAELFTDPRGYTVYRFYDGGEGRYYVVGPNGAQMLPTTKTVTVTQTNTVYVPTR